MSNGEQGETVTVQDRPMDDADVENTTTDDAGAPPPVVGGEPTVTASEASPSAAAADEGSAASSAAAGSALGGNTDATVAADDVAAAKGAGAGTADGDAGGADAPGSDADADADAGAGADGGAAGADAGAGVPAAASRSSRGSVRDLEEEGEVAADYLEELLDIVDVDGDIDIDVENGRASLAIVAEGGSDRSLRRLVGSNGEVLEALQELTRLAVQASTGERSRLMLDIAGHRAHRRKVLTDAAAKACAEVKSSGKPLSLDSMSAFERKIVHDVVADAGLNSESEGVDPHRHVVILPASA